MTQDLLKQLADYGEFCEEQQWPITADEALAGDSGGLEPQIITPRSIRRPRGWRIAGMAAVGVLAVGLVGVIAGTTASEGPLESQIPMSPTEVAPTEPAPVPLEGSREVAGGCDSSYVWVRVCDSAAAFEEGVMWSVTAGGPGLVAVGGDELNFWVPEETKVHSDADGDAVVWTSPDGDHWVRVEHDEAAFGGAGFQQMFDVTAGGPGLVAVGVDGTADIGEGNAAVWISSDGATWERVAHDEAVFGGFGDQRMLSVTAGGPGLVAVGVDGTVDTAEGNAAVWISSDGSTWERVAHDEAVFGGFGDQRMLSVTAGGPGLVAVGATSGMFTTDAAVWTSSDGLSWSRVPHDRAVFAATECRVFCDGSRFQNTHEVMRSVTAGGAGLIAVGDNGIEQGGWDGAVWTSSDGLTWSKVLNNLAPFHQMHYDLMNAVLVTESGITVVGRAADVAPNIVTATVWQSSG